MTGRDLYLWQKLFNLTPVEAGFELLNHRESQAEKRYVPHARTLAQWPWERCEPLGFDTESYDYWLKTVEECGMMNPKDTGSWVRHKLGLFQLFLLRPVDSHIDRLQWAPINRDLVVHKVHDYKGHAHKFIVLRNWEAQALEKRLPKYARQGNNIYATGDWLSIPMSPAVKYLHDESRQPHAWSTSLPQYRLNNGEIFRPQQNEYPVWYFLTATLAKPEVLKALLKVDELSDLRQAKTEGLVHHRLRHCEGLTLSTVDEARWRTVECTGFAYLVKNETEENRLRNFKHNYFFIVRCNITFLGGDSPSEVDGLAFIISDGKEVLQEMSSMPVKSIPGAVGNKRKFKGAQTFAPMAIAPKVDPIATVTTANASAMPMTARPPTEATPAAGFEREASQPPLMYRASFAAQRREIAAVGWTNAAIAATEFARTHKIPNLGYVPRKTLDEYSARRQTAFVVPRAKSSSPPAKKSEQKDIRSQSTEPNRLKRVSSFVEDADLRGDDDIEFPNYGAAGPSQAKSSSGTEHPQSSPQAIPMTRASGSMGPGSWWGDRRQASTLSRESASSMSRSTQTRPIDIPGRREASDADIILPPRSGPKVIEQLGVKTHEASSELAGHSGLSKAVDAPEKKAHGAKYGHRRTKTVLVTKTQKKSVLLPVIMKQKRIAANRAAMQISRTGSVTISDEQVERDRAAWQASVEAGGRPTGAALASRVRACFAETLWFDDLIRRRSFHGYTEHSVFNTVADYIAEEPREDRTAEEARIGMPARERTDRHLQNRRTVSY